MTYQIYEFRAVCWSNVLGCSGGEGWLTGIFYMDMDIEYNVFAWSIIYNEKNELSILLKRTLGGK